MSFRSGLSLGLVAVQVVGLGVSPEASAQTRGYRAYKGQNPGVTRYERDRDLYPECVQYIGTDTKRIPREVYEACMEAVDAADWVARKKATPLGCEDGYFTGFSDGLYFGSAQTASDSQMLAAGDREGAGVAVQPQFVDATGPARKSGTHLGQAEGASDARTTWVNALNRGLPQPQPNPKASVTYTDSPYANPYRSLGLPERSLGEMIAVEQVDPSNLSLYQEDRRRSRICGRFYSRSRSDFRAKDYYFSDGRYRFEQKRALDGQAAFDQWVDGRIAPAPVSEIRGRRAADGRRSDAPTRGGRDASRDQISADGYRQIRSKVVTVPASETPVSSAAPTRAPTETPASDANRAAPGSKNILVGNSTPTPTPTPAQPAAPVVSYDLGQIYRDTFYKAYAYYAEEAYSRGFYAMLDDGSNDGWNIGWNVGLNFAFQQGRVLGFNREFRLLEQQAYQTSYQSAYRSQYGQTFETYRTTPIISAQLIDVMGATDDGILQPGETIYGIYEIRNYGGVAGQLQLRFQGDGISSSTTQALAAPANKSLRVADTKLSGVIRPELSNFSQAEILLAVTGGHEPQVSPLRREVTRQITLEGVTAQAVSTAGVAKVAVTVLNRSPKLQTPDDVKIVISGAGAPTVVNLGRVAPNAKTTSQTVELKGLNPLSLLNEQAVVQVEVMIGNTRVAGSGSVVARQDSASRDADLAKIFNDSAQGTSTSSVARAALEQLAIEVIEEVKNIKNNRYSDDPEGTLLNEVMKSYRSTRQSPAAKALYQELGSRARAAGKKLRSLGFKTRGYRAFQRWMDELEG